MVGVGARCSGGYSHHSVVSSKALWLLYILYILYIVVEDRRRCEYAMCRRCIKPQHKNPSPSLKRQRPVSHTIPSFILHSRLIICTAHAFYIPCYIPLMLPRCCCLGNFTHQYHTLSPSSHRAHITRNVHHPSLIRCAYTQTQHVEPRTNPRSSPTKRGASAP